MTWTKDLPTKPGWYWWKYVDHGEEIDSPAIIRVFLWCFDHIIPKLYVCPLTEAQLLEEWATEQDPIDMCFWPEPIEPPEDL